MRNLIGAEKRYKVLVDLGVEHVTRFRKYRVTTDRIQEIEEPIICSTRTIGELTNTPNVSFYCSSYRVIVNGDDMFCGVEGCLYWDHLREKHLHPNCLILTRKLDYKAIGIPGEDGVIPVVSQEEIEDMEIAAEKDSKNIKWPIDDINNKIVGHIMFGILFEDAYNEDCM